MLAKKPTFMRYVVAHAVIEGDTATEEAQRWIDQGYQPWGVPSIKENTISKEIMWIQVFIKTKEERR